MSQTYRVSEEQTILNFDFSLPMISADRPAASPFRDAFTVSVQNGNEVHELLLVDQTGRLADPFGTAPGNVALGDGSLSANLSSLADQPVTLLVCLSLLGLVSLTKPKAA